jgi:hypothetical protein
VIIHSEDCYNSIANFKQQYLSTNDYCLAEMSCQQAVNGHRYVISITGSRVAMCSGQPILVCDSMTTTGCWCHFIQNHSITKVKIQLLQTRHKPTTLGRLRIRIEEIFQRDVENEANGQYILSIDVIII